MASYLQNTTLKITEELHASIGIWACDPRVPAVRTWGSWSLQSSGATDMFVWVKQWYINEAVPAVLTVFRDFFSPSRQKLCIFATTGSFRTVFRWFLVPGSS